MNRATIPHDSYDTLKTSLFSLRTHDLWGHLVQIMIFDITPAVSPRLQVWPGDTPPARELLQDMHRGDHITLSTLHATVHLGAHADAPSHYGVDSPTIDECSLDPYLGPCQVLRVHVPRRSCITPDKLSFAIKAPRLLLATGTYPDPESFNTDFAALAPELVEHLFRQGVRLIGIDTPSVDLFDSKDLPSHRQCLNYDMAILEGLMLKDVPDGLYELIALPLKLVDFDASPVRAILRSFAPSASANLRSEP
jgi:arylformamidase